MIYISVSVHLFRYIIPDAFYTFPITEHEWSRDGLKMVQIDGKNLCQASHLTAFSVLLDPLPVQLGSHAEALSIITYVGLAISTAALIATVATYALFR